MFVFYLSAILFLILLSLFTAQSNEDSKQIQNKFSEIYRKHIWKHPDGGGSGGGSTLAATEKLRKALPHIIDKYNVTSFLDAPCGSFVWMSVALTDIQKSHPKFEFQGVDIVPSVIEKNKKMYPNVDFSIHDIVYDTVPKKFDVIMSRDVFFHLTFAQIMCAVTRFQESGSRYLLTTTFSRNVDNPNADLKASGGFRRIHLRAPPLNFPEPLEFIDEHYSNKPNVRFVGLWDLNSLPKYTCEM